MAITPQNVGAKQQQKIHNIQNSTFVGTDEVRISIRNARNE